MPDLKTLLSVVAIVLTFIGFFPYVFDTLKNKTRPHVFSWLIWGITTSAIYALQTSSGAGSGAWVTLTLAAILFFIFFLGLRNGSKDIEKVDVLFLVLALLALPLWLVLDQPALSIIILSVIDMLGFVPTVRKAWNDPYSETVVFYAITTIRHVLSFFALVAYNIVTWLFPVTWIFANASFTLLLVIRRRKIKKQPQPVSVSTPPPS